MRETKSIYTRPQFWSSNVPGNHCGLNRASIRRPTRLKKQLLLNNQNITEWYDLEIPEITYGEDDEVEGLGFAQLSITVKSYNQWS